MILGMSTHGFTVLHVIISLIAIGSGLIVLLGMLGSHRLAGWTALFLLTTILTSVTGFLFPIKGFTPGLARSRCWRSMASISPVPGAGFMW
jgi:hypothetical protein